jgi:glyoxylase-like metal-dependent hydrolase (beta-lactamase superfamily II)
MEIKIMALHVEIIKVTPFQQNCSIIWCSKTLEGAVIDPGGDVDSLLATIQSSHIHIKKILLTHGHLDHAGGAHDLLNALSIQTKKNILIIGPHKKDAFLLESIEQQGALYGFSGAKNCKPDQWLNNNDTLIIGNETLTVYHCPGHTPGHVVFYHAESQLAFVGDVLFKGGIGRTDFPQGDSKMLIQSIVTQLWPLGGETRFISGHGAMSTFASERASNPFVADSILIGLK